MRKDLRRTRRLVYLYRRIARKFLLEFLCGIKGDGVAGV